MIDKEFFDLLHPYLAFQSISTDPNYRPEIKKTVTWLSDLFTSHGFSVHIIPGNSTNPLVIAAYQTSPQLPTVLVYGHYDVQPASPTGWNSPPFFLTIKDDRAFGRGVVDNKGQNLIHIFTVLQLIKQHKLAYNVKFILEGNEETSNPDLAGIISKNQTLFQSDYVLISDGEISGDKPTLEVSLRGSFNLTLSFTTASTSVHSGIYGGAIPNAAFELTTFLAKIYSANHVCQVPGFYQGVDPITPFQIKNTIALNADSRRLLKQIGVKKLLTEPKLNFTAQTGLRPTIQISGIKSGYTDTGYSNIVPATAEVRLNFRLVASQDPEKVLTSFKTFIAKQVPNYLGYQISTSGLHHPYKANFASPMLTHITSLLQKVYGTPPVTKYVGGSIPVVIDFKQILGIDSLLVSLGNDDCNMHGANENFRLDLLEKGLAFSRTFFSQKANV